MNAKSKKGEFNTQIVLSAPADLDVTDRAKKFRILRKDLLTALETRAWGIRILLEEDTPKDLQKQILSVSNGCRNWAKAISLEKARGMKLIVRVKTHPNRKDADLSAHFEKIEKPEETKAG